MILLEIVTLNNWIYFMTLIVNIFAGPGAGKSTLAAGLFHALKLEHIHVEQVMEYAKDLVWEERQKTLLNQVYVFGKQQNRVHRLVGKVDVVVTDSPFALSIFYGRQYGKYPESFYTSCKDIFQTYDNLNIFINRGTHYQTEGRNQTQEEAVQFDNKIKTWLDAENIPYMTVNQNFVAPIVLAIKERLKNGK